MARNRRVAVVATSAWIVLIIILLCPGWAAALGFQPVSQDELKMTTEPKAPGATAIILYRQVDRQDEQLRPREDRYYRIKILKEEGRDHANVKIPFNQNFMQIVNLHGRTIHADGSIVNFDGKVFEQTIFKKRGVRYDAKTFTLPDVQVGSILEYYYTIDFEAFYSYTSNWTVGEELFTKRARFNLKPWGPNIRWSWQGLTQPPKLVSPTLVTLEVSNVSGLDTEYAMPPEDELKPHVDFWYSTIATNEPARYWKQAGKDSNDNVESFVGKRGAIQSALSGIISQSDSPEQKARKIYARVQQLRNLSYEPRRTEQETKRNKEKAAAEFENVEDVWKAGNGTEFQLSELFLGLVRAAGIEARGIYVANRSLNFFHSESMNLRSLNSFVVVLRLDGKDVYCNPGIPYAPFGQLPWQVAGSPGLRIGKDGGAFVTTPLPSSEDSQIQRRAELTLDDAGSLQGRVTITYTGLEASQRRFDHRHDDDVARKKFLEDELQSMVPLASQAELTNHPEWTVSSSTLVAEFQLKIPGYAAQAGRRVLFAPGIFGGQQKHVFEHDRRVQSIYFEHPSADLDDISIALPQGLRPAALPEAVNQIQPDLIGFTTRVEAKPGRLHLARKFSNDIVLLDVRNYPALQSFYRLIRSVDEEPIVLTAAGAK